MTIALEKPNQQTQVNQPVDQNTVRRRGTGLRAYNPAKAFNGYTLFTPLTGQGEIYLIDIEVLSSMNGNFPINQDSMPISYPMAIYFSMVKLQRIHRVFLHGNTLNQE